MYWVVASSSGCLIAKDIYWIKLILVCTTFGFRTWLACQSTAPWYPTRFITSRRMKVNHTRNKRSETSRARHKDASILVNLAQPKQLSKNAQNMTERLLLKIYSPTTVVFSKVWAIPYSVARCRKLMQFMTSIRSVNIMGQAHRFRCTSGNPRGLGGSALMES